MAEQKSLWFLDSAEVDQVAQRAPVRIVQGPTIRTVAVTVDLALVPGLLVGDRIKLLRLSNGERVTYCKVISGQLDSTGALDYSIVIEEEGVDTAIATAVDGTTATTTEIFPTPGSPYIHETLADGAIGEARLDLVITTIAGTDVAGVIQVLLFTE